MLGDRHRPRRNCSWTNLRRIIIQTCSRNKLVACLLRRLWLCHTAYRVDHKKRLFPYIFYDPPDISNEAKSKATSDHWRRSKQLAPRGLLSNHDSLIPFAPSSGIRSSLTLFQAETQLVSTNNTSQVVSTLGRVET